MIFKKPFHFDGLKKYDYSYITNKVIVNCYARRIFSKNIDADSMEDMQKTRVLRSCAQYMCQIDLFKYPIILPIINIVSIILILPAVLYLLLKRLFLHTQVSKNRKSTVMFLHFLWRRRIVPMQYDDVVFIEKIHRSLSVHDLLTVNRLFQHRYHILFSPLFLSKCILVVSAYSDIIARYKPRNIINFTEGSFYSSFVTAYCETHEVKHVNIMHGDRFFYAGNAFCEFHEFHVWGEYYRNLFVSLHCPPKQFIISVNPVHKYLFDRGWNQENINMFKILLVTFDYYMTSSIFFKLLRRLIATLDKNWSVIIRPHYIRAYKKHCNTIYLLCKELGISCSIKTPEDNTIENAILYSQIVVSVASTTLLDAWIAGRKVICLYAPEKVIYPVERFESSKNVFVLEKNSTNEDIKHFIDEPPIRSYDELMLVSQFSNVKGSTTT
ncbi:MAG: hypothetical protein HQK96_04015 [Nitrospirae bacterium]|nr:hypothetical protein [Nitrospirota bacterium]